MNELKIGWAMRDVTTSEPVNIPGQFHMRISQGVIDPVTVCALVVDNGEDRSEEHTSELQSHSEVHLVCRLLLEKKKRI